MFLANVEVVNEGIKCYHFIIVEVMGIADEKNAVQSFSLPSYQNLDLG